MPWVPGKNDGIEIKCIKCHMTLYKAEDSLNKAKVGSFFEKEQR